MAEQRRTKRKTDSAKTSQEASQEEISFDYIKSNFFRVIHVDGVIGGLTPNGSIHMAIWNQRAPFPDRVTHSVQDEVVGPEVSRVQRDAILRELEAGLVFDVDMARVMVRWLSKQLEELKKIDEEDTAS